MIDINSNFSFKFVDQDQVFKEIKKLGGNKDSQKIDIPIEIMKKNIDITFYILYHNFNNALLDSEFPWKLKEADITPVHKKEEKYLKQKYRPLSILPNAHERLM